MCKNSFKLQKNINFKKDSKLKIIKVVTVVKKIFIMVIKNIVIYVIDY